MVVLFQRASETDTRKSLEKKKKKARLPYVASALRATQFSVLFTGHEA